MKMTQEELKAKLDAHKLWLETRGSDEVEGKQLDLTGAHLTGADLAGAHLTGADLTRADLTDADLTDADLTGANLTGADLTGANLTGANLTGADLTSADLTGADLTGADLTCADLTDADLTCANLTYVNLDYSAWPLRCSSLNVKIDKCLAAQLMYHTLRAMQSCSNDADIAAVLASPECVALANQFRRVDECGRLEGFSGESEVTKGKEGGAK